MQLIGYRLWLEINVIERSWLCHLATYRRENRENRENRKSVTLNHIHQISGPTRISLVLVLWMDDQTQLLTQGHLAIPIPIG